MTRESFKSISWNVSEPEYRSDPAYSYSTIAKFNKEGFNNLNHLFDRVESPSLVFGSMVDTLLTDGQQEFDNQYMVADFPKLSDTVTKIVKDLFKQFRITYQSIDLIPDNQISSVLKNHKFNPHWLEKTRIKYFKEDQNNCNVYYKLLYLAGTKTIVSTDDYSDVIQCVNTLKTNNMSSFYFESNNMFDESIERFYQLKFKGEYNGIQLRCMSDLIIVNHKDKTITPCDLKTSYKPEWDFYKSFIEWNYWIQAQLYWFIIRQNMDLHPIYKDYKLLDYKFIIISNGTKLPLVWEYVDTTKIEDLYYGNNNKYYCRNWRNIVTDLHYYLTNKPLYPIGIQQINDIVTYLNNE